MASDNVPRTDENLTTLQARIDKELFNRYQAQRERWGMNNAEFLERIIQYALPVWEEAKGPPIPAYQR